MSHCGCSVWDHAGEVSNGSLFSLNHTHTPHTLSCALCFCVHMHKGGQEAGRTQHEHHVRVVRATHRRYRCHAAMLPPFHFHNTVV
eukprot:m.234413 g.234413  ORF g.234413 m.234413 type:complete len:86 (+) comp15256_c1_seq11:128-385(+)